MTALRDLSGGGNDLTLIEGDIGGGNLRGPGYYRPADHGLYLTVNGWDDMYIDTPAPAAPVTQIDVAWEADRGDQLDINPGQTFYWFHQGDSSTGNDFAWAVGWHRPDGTIRVVTSDDGATADADVQTTVAPSFGFGEGRVGVTFDPATRVLSVYEQPIDAPRSDFDRPYSDDAWALVETVDASGTGTLYQSAAAVRVSSTTTPDEVPVDGGVKAVCGMDALYRLRVRHTIGGTTAAYLEASLIDLPLTWAQEDLSAYPPVGSTDTAQAATFDGRLGEPWTIHNYETGSYKITTVERPLVLFGNGSYGETPIDDAVFDDTGGSVTVMICYRSYVEEATGVSGILWSHKESDAANIEPGMQSRENGNLAPGPLAQVADGTTTVIAEAGTTLAVGQANVGVLTFDAATDELTAWRNDTPGTLEDTSGLGSLSSPGLPFRLAACLDGSDDQTGCFDGFAMARWPRVLSAVEIAAVVDEWLAGGRFTSTDDYAVSRYGA